MKFYWLIINIIVFSNAAIQSIKRAIVIALVTLVVGCSSGQVKPKIEANVKSEVIEIPAQAAVDFKKAIDLLNNDKLSNAENAFKKMIELYPQLAGPYANLGVIYSRQGKWAEAKDTLISGNNKNSKNIKILNQLGLVYRKSGDFSGAEKSYLAAISAKPNNAAAYLNLGILYDIYMGKFAKASGYYQKYQAMQTNPDRKVAGWIVDINRRAGIKTQIAGETGS